MNLCACWSYFESLKWEISKGLNYLGSFQPTQSRNPTSFWDSYEFARITKSSSPYYWFKSGNLTVPFFITDPIKPSLFACLFKSQKDLFKVANSYLNSGKQIFRFTLIKNLFVFVKNKSFNFRERIFRLIQTNVLSG